jgi:hypothetical protein
MLNILFQRSTVDVEIGKTGSQYYGTAKAAGRGLSERRAFRTINAAISLLEQHLTEAERKRDSAAREVKNNKVREAIGSAYGSISLYTPTIKMGECWIT